jgi:hypothetical protein
MSNRQRLLLLIASMLGSALVPQELAAEQENIRGQVTAVDGSLIQVRNPNGKTERVQLNKDTTVLTLKPASFIDVDFGAYVGAVSERMGDRYSPIYRDSLSWLYRGFELRIIDESLRGIALGHMKWDLTPQSVMTHGWVDDMEIRVLSIKYGPTEEEETDVEVARDVPVHKLSLGDKSMVKSGAHVFVGANRAPDGSAVALFLMVGIDGVVPRL